MGAMHQQTKQSASDKCCGGAMTVSLCGIYLGRDKLDKKTRSKI